MKRLVAFMVLAIAPFAYPQELKLAVLDKLKPQATNVVDLNLSKDLLALGAGFLGGGKRERIEAKIQDHGGDKLKKLVEGLNNIVIRSFEFDKEGVYSDAEVEQIIAEMSGPDWKLVISTNEKNKNGREISRIWTKSTGEGEMGGLRILSAEPKELTVIEITGKVSLKDLGDLGALGIPNIASEHTGQPQKKEE